MKQKHLDTYENIDHLPVLHRGVSRLPSQKRLRFLYQEQAEHRCDTRQLVDLMPLLLERGRFQAVSVVVQLQDYAA